MELITAPRSNKTEVANRLMKQEIIWERNPLSWKRPGRPSFQPANE